MYAQDYDEALPRYYHVPDASYDDGVSHGGYSAYSALTPYAKNAQMFACPSQRPVGTYTGWGDGVTFTSSYGFQWYTYLNDLRYNTLNFNNQDSSRVVLMTEFDASYHTAYMPWISSDGLFLHNDGQNSVFGDGHAKWMSKQNMIEGISTYGYVE